MKNYSEIVVVLDRSGSMQAILEDAIGGFNSFLESQKSVPGDANLTLVLFNDKYKFVLENVPLGMAKPLDKEIYVPHSTTALLDALGDTIDRAGAYLSGLPEDDRPNKVIFAILTDGLENASHRFTREQIFDKITHQREVYKWEFIFLAANQDAIQAGMSIGVPRMDTYSFASTPEGTQTAYKSMNMSVTRARKSDKTN